MATISIALTQRLAGVDCVTTYDYSYVVSNALQTTDISYFGTLFETVIVPLLNDLQSDDLTNISLNVAQRGYGGSSINVPLGGGGLILATAQVTLPPDLPLYCSQAVGQSVDADLLTAYTGVRPIRRGGIYFPGFTEDWSSVDGPVIPGSLGTQWSALVTALLAPRTTPGGREWIPTVFSTPKAALPPSPTYPDGRPARNALYAQLENVVPRRITRLKSRRP